MEVINNDDATTVTIEQLSRMLTAHEVAHILNLSYGHIVAWFKEPECPLKPKKIGGMWRVNRLDLATYVNNSGAKTNNE